MWIKHEIRGAEHAFRFLKNPEKFLTTTLVGTNIALVAASSLMAILLEPYLGGAAITAVSSVFLLFFGEILPKSIARDRATGFAVRASILLRGFYVFLYPLIWSVMEFSNFLLRIIGLETVGVRQFFSRKDLEMLVREGKDAGVVDEEDATLISRLILRGQQRVREIMIPRTDMTVVKLECEVETVIRLFEKTGYSRIPVIGESIDRVLGVIRAKDVMLERPDSLKSVMRDLFFVPESRLVGHLLRDMQREHMGMAIVVDEYGGTAGLVTLEDIVEEFFGQIQDEYDEDAGLYKKVSLHQIDVNAKIQITDLNDRFQLDLPEGDYLTIGGLLMDRLGHIPKRGEKVEFERCTVIVISAFRKKVNWVRILRKKEGQDFVHGRP